MFPFQIIQKSYQIIKPTQKQFSNYHLLHTVRQINGDIAFKQIYERSFIIKFNQRLPIPQPYCLQHFGYILQGEVFVYKHSKNKYYQEKYQHQIPHSLQLNQKVFITCHKSHQLYGLQEYPLNWSQNIIFQATQNTKIILFAMELSLTSFKKIFNMGVVQNRAQVLKRCDFFKGLQLDKLKKISLFSRRLQGLKGQIILKKGDELKHLLVIMSGQIMQLNETTKTIIKKQQIIGLNEITQSQNGECQFYLTCLTDCQILMIPKSHIVKMHKIKYRLEEKQSIQFKSRRVTEYQTVDKQKLTGRQIKCKTQYNSVFFNNQSKDVRSQQKRPITSNYPKTIKTNNARFSTFYDHKHQSSSKTSNLKLKTEGSQSCTNNYTTPPLTSEFNQNYSTLIENSSLGQLYLRKFLYRKERRQNCQIVKYLRSNAPELQLNPAKEYAVVKPLHVSDSSYIKNLKRKLKRTYLKNGSQTQKIQKPKTRFSFFFKQDSTEL